MVDLFVEIPMFAYVCIKVDQMFVCFCTEAGVKVRLRLQIHVNPEALIFCPLNHYFQNGLLPQDRSEEWERGKRERERKKEGVSSETWAIFEITY